MSSTWSSEIGKFPKKDPDHGSWTRKIKHWFRKLTKGKCCGGNCQSKGDNYGKRQSKTKKRKEKTKKRKEKER